VQHNLHPLLIDQLSKLGNAEALSNEYGALLDQISDAYKKDDSYIADLEQKVSLRTEQLLSSTSQAYSFLDSLSMGFIMSDINGEIVLTNNSAREILSARVIEKQNSGELAKDIDFKLTMSTIETLMKPQLDFKQLIARSIDTNEPVEWKELDYGKYVLHLFVTSLFNQQNPGSKEHIGAVILIENITQQVVIERSKDDFLSIASHELRTPLTAIRGNASLINKYYGDQLPNEDVKEMISDIHESSIRLIDIVNDFLDASSLEQGKIIMSSETFSVNDVLTDVARELQSLGSAKNQTKRLKTPLMFVPINNALSK
jgi:signal transduction histidine kinase